MRKGLFFLACLMIAACQPVTVERRDDGPVPVTLRVDDAAYWLEEWYRVTSLPAGEVEDTLRTREQEFSERPSPRTRLRLVLLLAEGPAVVRDQPRAQALLRKLDAANASASARALAALLGQVIKEQVASSDKIIKLQQNVTQAEDRVKELERQLQELTNIEQSIQQRETPVERKEKE